MESGVAVGRVPEVIDFMTFLAEARRLILNTYKTLLTRGQKGCYVYCEDEALREYMKKRIR